MESSGVNAIGVGCLGAGCANATRIDAAGLDRAGSIVLEYPAFLETVCLVPHGATGIWEAAGSQRAVHVVARGSNAVKDARALSAERIAEFAPIEVAACTAGEHAGPKGVVAVAERDKRLAADHDAVVSTLCCASCERSTAGPIAAWVELAALSERHERTPGRVASSLAQELTGRRGEAAGRDITGRAIAGASWALKRAAEIDAALGVHLGEAITKSEAACADVVARAGIGTAIGVDNVAEADVVAFFKNIGRWLAGRIIGPMAANAWIERRRFRLRARLCDLFVARQINRERQEQAAEANLSKIQHGMNLPAPRMGRAYSNRKAGLGRQCK